MQQNHFALSWIHFRCCFNVELAKATCIPSRPSFFSTNTVGKAQGLLFSAIWLFINSTGASPSCVGLWMKCHLSTKSCLIIISFLQLVLAFQEISFLGLWIIVMLAWNVQLPFTGPVFDVVANRLLIFLSALVAFCQVLCQGISKKGLAADGQNKWKISLLSKNKIIWQ